MHSYCQGGLCWPISEWTETRINELQTLRAIAFKIIAFISQFENDLVRIWNKPKFALSSEFEDGEVVDTRNLDWKRIKPLIWW